MPKIAAIAMPAKIPHSAPTAIEPDIQAPAKPHAAPTIIIPSTPRLSTPERSTTSSPDDANNSGVEAVTTVRMKLTEKIRCRTLPSVSSMRGHGFDRSQQPQAVDD